MVLMLDIDISETENSQYIDKEFDRIIAGFQDRRKVLKQQLQEKCKVR
jgi:hypothetical protein